MNLLIVVPAIIQCSCIRWFPESPLWLYKHRGRDAVGGNAHLIDLLYRVHCAGTIDVEAIARTGENGRVDQG